LSEHKSLLKLTNDAVFKAYFSNKKNRKNLIFFLKSILNISDDEFIDLELLDTNSLIEQEDDKRTILDLKIKLTNQTIIVELQIDSMEFMEKRIVYGISKNLSTQLIAGDEYNLTKVVSILIADYKIVKDKTKNKYHYKFTLNDKEIGYTFTDVIEIHTLELKRLPKTEDGTHLYNWLKIIKSDSLEELNMIAKKHDEFKEAAEYLKEISQDEVMREIAFKRETFLRDWAARNKQSFNKGLEQGIEQGEEQKAINIAKNMLKRGTPIEYILEDTGLDINIIKKLQNEK